MRHSLTLLWSRTGKKSAIRNFGSYPEGVCYSILVMNCTTWLLDKYIKPVRFGTDPAAEKAAKKAAKEAAK